MSSACRSSCQACRSCGASSSPCQEHSRVAAYAPIFTEPRSTRAGEAPLRLVVPADGTTIAADDRCFGIGAAFHLTLQGAHTANRLFEYFFGMPVRFVNGFRGFTEIMEVKKLRRDLG